MAFEKLTPRSELGIPENRPGVPEPGSALTPPQTVEDRLESQHPLHGVMARVYERLGGEEYIMDWAEENPDKFIPLMLKLAPVPIPKGQSGGVHLHVHNTLQPGALDGADGIVIDAEPE